MNVPRVNLLPRASIEARTRRAWRRRWVLVDAVSIVAVVLGGVGSRLSSARGGQAVETRLRDVTAEIAALEQSAPVRRASLDGVQRRLRASEAVRQRPDWGALLAYIDSLRGEGVVLDLVVVDGAGDEGVSLRVSGMCAEQGLESGLVLGLERSGLFETTRLVKSERVSGPGGQRISFEIVSEFLGAAPVAGVDTP